MENKFEATGMKIKEKFMVVSSEVKSGTSARGDWSKTEYLLKNTKEREDGSIVETMITADTTQAIGDLEVGATYNMALFISSREFEKDGKKMHFVSFRVTYTELVSTAAKSEDDKKAEVTAIGDDIPF